MQENKMGIMPVRPLLLQMSWPIMLSMLIQALYNMVDSFFVARISAEAFEALALVYPVQTLMIAICVGTGVGVNAMLSRRLGEKRLGEANAVAVNGYFLYFATWLLFVVLSLAFGRGYMAMFTGKSAVFRFGLDYLTIVTVCSLGVCFQFAAERVLQATGNAVGPMIVQGIGAVVNLILDPVLIFGIGPFPRLEVVGAALATVIGQIVGMVVGLVMVAKNPVLTLRVRGFRPSGKVIGDIYRIGAPAIAMQALTTVMTMGMNKILAQVTETGVFILGAYFKLQSFIFMPVYGLNNGLTPLVSFNYGARHRERIRGLIRFALAIACGIMAAGTLLMLLAPGPLLRIFDATQQVLADGVPALRIIAASFLFAGVSIVLCAAFQAMGSATLSLVVSLLRQAVVLLPAALLLGLVRPGLVWLAFPVAEVLSCGVAALLYKRLRRTKIMSLEDV